MSVQHYKGNQPRIKDTGKEATGEAAKAGSSRKRGNPPGPKASAASSHATGVNKSGKTQVKNNSLNSIVPYLIKYKSTSLNNVKVSNLNKQPLLIKSPISCAQTGSINVDNMNPNFRKNSDKLHAQKGSVINESIQRTFSEPSLNNSNTCTSDANIQDCTIYGQSFFDCESDDYDINNEPIIVYPHIHDSNNDQFHKTSFLQEEIVPTDDFVEDCEGNKRPIASLDELITEGRNTAKRNRNEGPPKLSYASCAKQYIMLEFRASNPKVQLRQEDYGNIESKLAYAYATLPKPRPESIPKIQQMGLAQGALWCAAKDNFTYNFCMEHVPSFDTPDKYLPNPLLPPKPKPFKNKNKNSKLVKPIPDDPELVKQWEVPENQLVYTYQVYGPNNRPFRYLKGRFPMGFWAKPDEFIELIRAFHPELDKDVDDISTGLPRKQHMRVSAGMEDKADIIGGYFTLSIEVEEELMPVLAELNGTLQILSTSVRLIGGGIDKAIEDLHAPLDIITTSNEEYDETYDPTAPTTSEPPAATDPFDLDLNDENNETLFQNMQEGDGTYMLDDNEDLMDHTVGNPTDDPSNN
jgi:hypothetical protein